MGSVVVSRRRCCENALAHELRKAGLVVLQPECINYLSAIGLDLGLSPNFGKSRVEVQRTVRGL
jgi:hypothetical protein